MEGEMMKKGDVVYVSDFSKEDALNKKEKRIFLTNVGGKCPFICVKKGDEKHFPYGDYNNIDFEYAVPGPKTIYRIKSIEGILRALADLGNLEIKQEGLYSLTDYGFCFPNEMFSYCKCEIKHLPKLDSIGRYNIFGWAWLPSMIESVEVGE